MTNLVAGEQTTECPTQNHATLAANTTSGTATLSEGNLKITGTGSGVSVNNIDQLTATRTGISSEALVTDLLTYNNLNDSECFGIEV